MHRAKAFRDVWNTHHRPVRTNKLRRAQSWCTNIPMLYSKDMCVVCYHAFLPRQKVYDRHQNQKGSQCVDWCCATTKSFVDSTDSASRGASWSNNVFIRYFYTWTELTAHKCYLSSSPVLYMSRGARIPLCGKIALPGGPLTRLLFNQPILRQAVYSWFNISIWRVARLGESRTRLEQVRGQYITIASSRQGHYGSAFCVAQTACLMNSFQITFLNLLPLIEWQTRRQSYFHHHYYFISLKEKTLLWVS